MPALTPAKNYVNHIFIALDVSGSMQPIQDAVVKVVDRLGQELADTSVAMNQETRITIFLFNHNVLCAVWETDVLRRPSIKELYFADGGTAMIDAIRQALADVSEVSQKYGDHGFVLYVITDGDERDSNGTLNGQPGYVGRGQLAAILKNEIVGAADNVTVAMMVPSVRGVLLGSQWGVPKGNIMVWDATSDAGVEEMGRTIQASTANYMTARTSGIRKTANLFALNVDHINATDLKAGGYTPLQLGTFDLVPLGRENKVEISDFLTRMGYKFRIGMGFYQLTKPETIQADKEVAIVNDATAQVFKGLDARKILGLPDHQVKVAPAQLKGWTIFIQSKAPNRHLLAGTKVLVIK